MSSANYTVRIGDREFAVSFTGDGRATLGNRECGFDVGRTGDSVYSVLLDGASYTFAVSRDAGATALLVDGVLVNVDVETARDRLLKQYVTARQSTDSTLPVVAPMPSLVVRIAVTEGQNVEAGQPLLVLEAMKMENELRSMRQGVVRTIHVACGKAVEKGEVLITIE